MTRERKVRLLSPIFMALIMSALMTAVITYINLGLRPDFGWLYLKAWLVAWPCATIAAFIAAPLSRRLIGLILGPEPDRA